LSSRLKAGRVVDEITSTGRAFQTRATMTGHHRSVDDVVVCGSSDHYKVDPARLDLALRKEEMSSYLAR